MRLTKSQYNTFVPPSPYSGTPYQQPKAWAPAKTNRAANATAIPTSITTSVTTVETAATTMTTYCPDRIMDTMTHKHMHFE